MSNVVQGNNEFALNLYHHLLRDEKSNLFFSPYSISNALAMTFAGADLEQMDFNRQPELTCRKINQWVEDQTSGKITNLISPAALSEFTRLLLVNAAYFKGGLTEKFEEADTKEASFHLGLLNKAKVQMMHQQTDFSYAKVDGIQILELPYGDPQTPSGLIYR